MQKSRLIASALLLALLAACGSDPDTESANEADTPSPDVTEATSDGGETGQSPADGGSDPTAAKRALGRALDTMQHDDATGFKSLVLLAGDTYSETTGVTVVSGWASSSTFTPPNEDEPAVMDVRSTNGTVWMQMQDWPPDAQGCWLAMDAGQVPVGILAMTPDEPVYYSILASLGTSGFANEAKTDMVGDLRADAAINLLNGQVVAELDLAGVRGSDRVPVEIGYDGSRITYVTMAGSDVLQMVEDAGGSASDMARTALEFFEAEVTYTLPDEVPTVSAPPANLVMTTADMTPTGGGCH